MSDSCTRKQADVLCKFGYDPNVTFDEASAIIDRIAANGWKRPDEDGDEAPKRGRKPAGKAKQERRGSLYGDGQPTEKQIRTLQKFGLPTDVSFERASQLIARVAENNWQPIDIEELEEEEVEF